MCAVNPIKYHDTKSLSNIIVCTVCYTCGILFCTIHLTWPFRSSVTNKAKLIPAAIFNTVLLET